MQPRRTLSRQLRSVGPYWVSPVDSVEHISQLRARDLQAAVGRRGPDEASLLQPLRVKRHANPVVPDDLDEIRLAATKDVEIAAMRVTAERLLHLQRQ